MKTGPPHFAMLHSWDGHLIPLAELAKRLAVRHDATTTLITFASMASITQHAFLASLPSSIHSLPLPPVDLSDLPHDAAIEKLMFEECARSIPALTGIFSSLKDTTRLVAFITDPFGIDSFDAARDAGVRRCLFTPSNLHAQSLLLHLPELAASVTSEFRDLTEPVRQPGCVPISGSDILAPLQERSSPPYMAMMHLATRHHESDVILVNSFNAIKPEAAKVLRQPEPGRPPVYSIGHLTLQSNGTNTDANSMACLGWLDQQPAKSVIFVSFGSGGSILLGVAHSVGTPSLRMVELRHRIPSMSKPTNGQSANSMVTGSWMAPSNPFRIVFG